MSSWLLVPFEIEWMAHLLSCSLVKQSIEKQLRLRAYLRISIRNRKDGHIRLLLHSCFFVSITSNFIIKVKSFFNPLNDIRYKRIKTHDLIYIILFILLFFIWYYISFYFMLKTLHYFLASFKIIIFS